MKITIETTNQLSQPEFATVSENSQGTVKDAVELFKRALLGIGFAPCDVEEVEHRPAART
jgi:hypothetical protein